MKNLLLKITTFFLFLNLLLVLLSCRQEKTTQHENQPPASGNTGYENQSYKQENHRKKHGSWKNKKGEYADNEEITNASGAINNATIPPKVYDILNYVKQNNTAPDGYVGGRHFGNFENHLPKKDASGKRINYQEWDVNPHSSSHNRGVERLITGSDGKAYYTNNHYQSFTEVK